jgi:hypothetical protein
MGRSSMVAVLAALMVMASAGAAFAGAGPQDGANMNAGTIELDCEGNPVTIWVNFVASERSGESPALVVTGTDGRVFKVMSFSIEDDPDSPYSLRFPAPDPPFERVECTHPSPWGEVTLVGAFIP